MIDVLTCVAVRPSDETIEVLLEKLDVDHDSFVPLADIISLAEGEGLGIVIGEDDTLPADISSPIIVKDAVSNISASTPAAVSTPPSASTPATSVPKEKKEEKKLKKEDIVEG